MTQETYVDEVTQRLTENTDELNNHDEQHTSGIEDRELKHDLDRDASRYTKEFQGRF